MKDVLRKVVMVLNIMNNRVADGSDEEGVEEMNKIANIGPSDIIESNKMFEGYGHEENTTQAPRTNHTATAVIEKTTSPKYSQIPDWSSSS